MGNCGLSIAGHLEQVGAHRTEAMVRGKARVGLERREQLQACRRPMHHRRGDGAIERHHRVVRHLLEQPVERQDLRPVGVADVGGFVMDRGDRGLQLIGADRAARQRRRQERDSFLDGRAIP